MKLDFWMSQWLKFYWIFPDPIVGSDGYENGKDYEYLAQLVVITEENKDE